MGKNELSICMTIYNKWYLKLGPLNHFPVDEAHISGIIGANLRRKSNTNLTIDRINHDIYVCQISLGLTLQSLV